jgi:hypothetical protein
MWEGGKGNLKKLHLVSWDKIQRPYREGGLQVRSIHAQNLAMGSKLLWQLVSGRSSWSKKVLWKKYFTGQRQRCLDKNPPNKKGSPIFKLCLKALEHFRSLLYWIPGNGKRIKVWEDSILGEEPLGQNLGIQNIKQWLQEQHVFTLWDLSAWDNENNWIDWNLGDHPSRLEEEAKLLSKLLQGKAPLNQAARDKRGWGTKSGSFTTAEGYQSLMAIPHVAPNPIPLEVRLVHFVHPES